MAVDAIAAAREMTVSNVFFKSQALVRRPMFTCCSYYYYYSFLLGRQLAGAPEIEQV